MSVATEEPRARTRKTERHEFQMHAKLLTDIIKRQAGTLEKAIMECVMNSIDAKAKRCDITVTADKVVVSDDGRGITKRKDLLRVFKVFGLPHDEEEEKTYGTFRMGRGQAFKFGRNTWRTGPFQMIVDINKAGQGFDLTREDTTVKGCTVTIELYEDEKPLPSDLNSIQTVLTKWLKYSQIQVTLNQKIINVDREAEEWDSITDDAYIKLNESGCLSVYNLGVHVLDMGGYILGSGGVVISKHQLKVNFARNDIQSDCPVWKRIKPDVDRRAQREVDRSKRLTEHSRQRLANLIKSGNYPKDVMKLALFTSVSGKHHSVDQIVRFCRGIPAVSSVETGDLFGDSIMRRRRAFVFSKSCLTRFEETLSGLVEVIRNILVHERYDSKHIDRIWSPKLVTMKELRDTVQDTFEELDAENLTPTETVWLAIANAAQYSLFSDNEVAGASIRQLLVGESTVADGWTDGTTYIAINRPYLRELKFDIEGFLELGRVLLHEYGHSEADNCGHTHDQAFYEAYHDASGRLGAFVQRCITYLPTALRTAGRKISQEVLRGADSLERVRRGIDEMRATCETSLLTKYDAEGEAPVEDNAVEV